MAGYSRSPNVLKGGFVVMDAEGKQVLRVHTFQYNPDTLSRTLSSRGAVTTAGDNFEGLRLTGPPVETIAFEIEFDATDALEHPNDNAATVEHGIAPELAALETFITPLVDKIVESYGLADRGVIEIFPEPGEMLLLVLGPARILPVRITGFNITEEAFDLRLNPILAKVSFTFQVLGTDDLAFSGKAAEMFLAHLKRREGLVAELGGSLRSLGLETI